MTPGFTRAAALVALAAAGALTSRAAMAQAAGSLLVRAGATEIKPSVQSGDLTAPSFAGTQSDILADTQPSGGVTYMWTDHLAIDVPLAAPYTHDIVGAGAIAGSGKLGEVKSLPITVFGQYRFLDASSAFRPYLGLGATYARFYKARGTEALSALTGGTIANPTTLAVESKFAPTAEAGIAVALDAHWFVDGFVAKTFLKIRTTLSTGQTLDAQVDPTSIGLAVGYKF